MLDDSHLTDPGLVADVRVGRREAFGELYRRYYSGALRYALSMTRGDECRAQDIVSEAFTRVFRAMSRDSNVSAFWPYLLASVRNAHRAELRRSGRVDLVERADDLDALVPVAPSPADRDDPSVRAAFRRLPPRWQLVLWRTEICGDTAAEIGHDMGISANAAAALAFRAREGLRVEYLQDHLKHAVPDCQPYAEQLARLVRGVLGRRDRRRIETHVRTCHECQRALADLTALNGRMHSVLPLILGVWPFASGQGLSSAPAGAAGSGLLGSAGAAASGAVGTAGLTGGTTGTAGLAGLGGIGAIGMTHATAVAGLAVASVVAVLGIPIERSIGEPDHAPPALSTVVPDDGATADLPAGPVQPELGSTDLEASTEEPLGEELPADADPAESPSDDPVLDGEAVTVSDGADVDAGLEVIDQAEDGAVSDPDASGAEELAFGGGGSGSVGAEPLSSGAPRSEQAADHWPDSDDGSTFPGQGGAPYGDGEPSGPAKPEQPTLPTQATDPVSSSPERPTVPTQAADSASSKAEQPTLPEAAAAPRTRNRSGRP